MYLMFYTLVKIDKFDRWNYGKPGLELNAKESNTTLCYLNLVICHS